MTSASAGSGRDPRTNAIVVVAVIVVLAAVVVLGLRALGVGRDRTAVILIGDSITYNLEKTARSDLGDEYAIAVEGVSGAMVADQLPATAAASKFPFDQAVVNLGTNDVMNPDVDLSQSIAGLNEIVVTLNAADCISLVTVSESMVLGSNSGEARAKQVNEAIRAIAAQHDNVEVIDWAAIVRQNQADNPDPITSDTVHPNDLGNELLADAYGEALAACA